MPGEPTPDLERVAFGFRSSSHPVRVETSRRMLVDLPLALGPWVTKRLSRTAQHRALRRWSSSLLAAAGVRIHISGRHGLGDGPYLVMALHESFVDVPVLSTLPLDLRFTAREELFDDPRLGGLLHASHHIPVPERRTAESVRTLLRAMRSAVADGDSVVVFPQGTLLGVESAFQPGFVRLPHLLDLPVLPVSIAGTHRVWDYPFSDEVHIGERVDVSVLEPVPVSAWNADRARDVERSMKRHAVATRRARRFEPSNDGWWDDYAYEIDPDFSELHGRVRHHRRSTGAGTTPD